METLTSMVHVLFFFFLTMTPAFVVFRLSTRWSRQWWRCPKMSPHRRNAQTKSSGRWTQIVTVNLPGVLLQAEEKSCSLKSWQQSPRCCHFGLAICILTTWRRQTSCRGPKDQRFYSKANIVFLFKHADLLALINKFKKKTLLTMFVSPR